jgi:hypothetical protein
MSSCGGGFSPLTVMSQAPIATSSRNGVSITPTELRTHGKVVNILRLAAAGLTGTNVTGRVVHFENAHDGRHVLSIDEFAALLAHDPDLKNLNKLMENMSADIR